MNEQITTAAELDALPVGSVVARLHNDGHGNSVYTLTDEGWRAATEPLRPGVGPVFNQDDERMADLTVLYRPDQPQRVQPTREGVAARAAVKALEDLMATAEHRGHRDSVPMILIEECWHVLSDRADRIEREARP